MPTPILTHTLDTPLRPAPINPAWVIDGAPTARCAELSRSADGLACTVIWDCTPGRFEWIYDTDETIHILEGSIVLDDGVADARRLGPGDIVFSTAGARVRWTVETHVRKLAFVRRGLPKPAAAVVVSLRLLKMTGPAMLRRMLFGHGRAAAM